MAHPPSVLVVIVNYRTPLLTIDCLRSLESEVLGHAHARVAVVDNNSRDGSADVIAAAIQSEGWSSWASLMRSSVNGGFSYGNNFAVRPALAWTNPPACFWLLNPDTVVHKGTLGGLTEFLGAHPEVGICGGGINEENDEPWPFAFRFPSLLSELERALGFGPATRLLKPWMVQREMSNVAERVDWICGASLVVRREVFEQIGLMDDEYFLYFEETDFCLQAQRAGFQCWYVPQHRVMHISGQSTGVTGKSASPRRLPAYWFDSRRRYFVKNHGRAYAAFTDAVWLFGHLLGRLRRWLQRKPYEGSPHYLQDFFTHSALRKSGIQGGVATRHSSG